MAPPAATLSVNDAMNVVMKTFDSTSAYTLPVLDEDGRLEGYITRSRVLTTYRQMVADMSDE